MPEPALLTHPPTATSPRRRGPARLLAGQTIMQLRTTLRNPMAAFFTLGFPLMFLVLFNALMTGSTKGAAGTGAGLPFAQVYTPGIAAFAIIAACFTNLAISVTTARDAGILKRVRGTPLPAWTWLTGRMLAALTWALASVVIMTAVAVVLFDVQVVWHAVPAAVFTVIVGGATFCALGFAATTNLPNAEAGPAVLNLLVFPIVFVSGIFFPIDQAPAWLVTFAKLFPVHHLAAALQSDFDPTLTGSGFAWWNLAVLALWALGGLAVALRFFRWESTPRALRPPRSRKA